MPSGRETKRLSKAASTRGLFTELVTSAREELGQSPSPQATGYVVDLLDSRVRSEVRTPAQRERDTLAEAMVDALVEQGTARFVRLRALGDRALFDAGFFEARVARTVVGGGYYEDIGRTAYSRLSAGLATGPGATRSSVFRELSQHFSDFVLLLAEVGERVRGDRSVDLLQLYDRYREHGAERDRVRLLRHGLVPSLGPGPDTVQ
jgi:hypothetical protein